MPEKIKMFPALSLLEKRAQPRLHGHEAYFRAPIPVPAQHHVLIPSWSWTGVHAESFPKEDTITLDVNGSYMAALGAVDIAFSDLRRMGPIDALALPPRESGVLPGYYRIIVPHWALDASIVHPLGGDAERLVGKPVWIAHPTLVLLLQLLDQQYLTYFDIVDSWVSGQRVNFRAWNVLLKQTRDALLDDVEEVHEHGAPRGCKCRSCAVYTAFKEGYGAAFAMMRTGESCRTRRPDWADAVYAQHAAARWRNAWKFIATGPVLYMGSTDELTVTRADLSAALDTEKPPFKMDATGRILGHYKVKPDAPETEQPERQAAAAPYSDNPYEDDIL